MGDFTIGEYDDDDLYEQSKTRRFQNIKLSTSYSVVESKLGLTYLRLTPYSPRGVYC